MSTSEKFYLKQQQNIRNCKLDNFTALNNDQSYKCLVDHHPNLTKQQQQKLIATSELDGPNGMAALNDKRFDPGFLKMINSKSSNCSGKQVTQEKEVISPIGYPRSMNVVTSTIPANLELEQLQQLKYNYPRPDDCQRFIINNTNSLKAAQQQNSQVS